MKDVALVILGWFLGIMTHLIVERVQRKRQLEEVNAAILAELDELRFSLAWAALKVSARRGQVDRQTLAWLADIAKTYRGPLGDPKVMSALAGLASLPDHEIASLVAAVTPKGTAIDFKKISTPALTVHLQALASFPEEYQRLSFDIVRQVEALNQEIANARSYFEWSFNSSLSADNRDRAAANQEGSYALIDRLARWIIQSIERLQKYRSFDFGPLVWFHL